MFQKISYILLLAFLALSCTDIVKEADHTNTIDFQTAASTDSWVETKSAPVTELTEPFGIFAYCYKGDWSETNTANFMNNLPVSKNGSYWQTAINYYWPGSSYNMKFFAYYPYGQSQLGISSTTGTLQLSYTVPADVADQADVMTASVAYPGDHYDPVDLHFQHVLTAIRFAVGDDMIGCTISKITIKGVYGYGLYKVGDASWTGQGNVRNYEQTLDVTVDGTPGADITTAIQTFMMIPQTIPSGAYDRGQSCRCIYIYFQNHIWQHCRRCMAIGHPCYI
jgi:hypothetical protein